MIKQPLGDDKNDFSFSSGCEGPKLNGERKKHRQAKKERRHLIIEGAAEGNNRVRESESGLERLRGILQEGG